MIQLLSHMPQVCSGSTGHAEAVRFEYDPAKATFADLVSASAQAGFTVLGFTCRRHPTYHVGGRQQLCKINADQPGQLS